jgi:thiamine kinase-like enzyme
LKRLHGSHTLRDSLSNFDRSVSRPSEMLARLLDKPNSVVATNTFLNKIASEMLRTVPILNNLAMVVVHGNISPDNWLKAEKTGKIYLIDWKTVSLGDAYLDNAFLLSHYIPSKDWNAWLARSGERLDDVATLSKLIWYGKLSFLRQIDFHFERSNTNAVNSEIQGLRRFMDMFE